MSESEAPIDVDALIAQLRDELGPVDEPKVDAAALMRKVRAEVARRRAQQDVESGNVTVPIELPYWFGSQIAPPPKREYLVGELLALDDREFVEAAYRALLRREGDPDGIEGNLKQLRDGVSKVEILHALRWSPEGLARGVHVDGLLAPYLLQKLRRIPLLGTVLGWGHSLLRLPWLLRGLAQTDANRARELQDLGQHVNRLAESVQDKYCTSGEFRLGLSELEGQVSGLKRELGESNRRLAELEALVQSRWRYEHPLAPNALDEMYVEFEERFRGSSELIRARARIYLDLVREVAAGTADAPVVDLGCGRGDWLDLLRENGLVGIGIDNNQAFLHINRARGHTVIEADALQGLRDLPDRSVGAITGMHIAEHLPFEVLVALIDESLRVLRPGGLLALETPNPENLAVASCYFYLDPTHRNPLPPDALHWIVQARGFDCVRIERLREAREVNAPELVPDDIAGSASINHVLRMLRNTADYAVLGRAP